ncbi:MAG TPA: nucleoside triphosphate pyrophosphohydrolase [Candidatus Limnocylindria bacterium]|nr:nucleoside triphosphate pyrophosphohydrolase [Candidatus Limnocylindria bacterium]
MSRRSLDALLAAAGLNPADGVQVAAAEKVAALPVDPSLPLILLAGEAADPADRDGGGGPAREDPPVLPGRHARRSTREVLATLYPHGHPARPLPDGEPRPIERLTDDDLRSRDWYLAPLPPLDNLASLHGMAAISARLRAPDGCPWDRRQTHASLRPFLLEEAYEAVDALDRGATGAELAEELGDLLLQVVLHAQLAAEEGAFDLTDVHRSIAAKIVRRHPHVFAGLSVSGVEQVLANWETIKASERQDAGREPSPFAGIARALPALAASREIQERASSLGWDWPSVEGVWEKVGEELDELRAAASVPAGRAATNDEERSRDARLHELGDVLFALVNLARWLRTDPEEALRAANRRWIERYERVEALARERGIELAALDLEAKDRLWDEVKQR